MKLDKKVLTDLIKEALTDKQSVLLESPGLDAVMNETTFNRVKQHVDESGVKFLVIAADRHIGSKSPDGTRATEETNNENTNKLAQKIDSSGYPSAKQKGSWMETDEDKNEVRVIERSFIVYDYDRPDKPAPTENLYELGKRWAKEYNQDAFIYGWIDETEQRQIQARHPDGSIAKYGGPWTTLEPIEADAEFWSKVRGSHYVFTEYNIHENVIEVEAPNSVIEAMRKAQEYKGKKIKFVRRKR
jgi:hypothetical protein